MGWSTRCHSRITLLSFACHCHQNFYKDPDQTQLILELKTAARHQVHEWCNKQTNPPLSHDSTEIPG